MPTFTSISLAALIIIGGFGLPAWAQVPPADNFGQAMSWYLKAAEAGDSEAQFLLARMLDTGAGSETDPAGAIKWYRAAALRGHAQAAFHLGEIYYRGTGVARDYTEAANWYQRAARAGSARAQFNLALIVERGRGVRRDAGLAVKWYLRAANAGLIPAQINLALMYAAGNGVPLDPVQAMMWLRISEHMGAARLNNVKSGIAVKLTPEQVRDAEESAADRVQFIRANMAKSRP